MSSDFAEAGKRFETTILVPELELSTIRNRSRIESARRRSRTLVLSAIAAIAILGSGSVLAGTYGGGIRIWSSGDKAAMLMRSFTTIGDPTAADLRRVAGDATFPVVFPVGLPKEMRVNLLFVSPADHPSTIGVQYVRGSTGSYWSFMLADSSVVDRGALPPFPTGGEPFGKIPQWTVGREAVFGEHATGVRSAMLRSTPAESLAQTLPMLHRVEVLGGFYRLAVAADEIAPSDGRSVLAGRANLAQIAGLAREHKPLVSSRTRSVDNIPIVSGRPDWAHQTSHSVGRLAVSAGGVRALDAVLASKACGSAGTMGSGFTCEMLINERSGRAYWIWVLPVGSSGPPVKYVVDAATFRIESASAVRATYGAPPKRQSLLYHDPPSRPSRS